MNPYKPTLEAGVIAPAVGTRSVWFSLLTGVLALACIVLALVILFETLGIAMRNGSWNAELTKGATASSAIGLFGGCWMCSSLLFWLRRRSLATTIGVGTLGSAMLFVVLACRGVIL